MLAQFAKETTLACREMPWVRRASPRIRACFLCASLRTLCALCGKSSSATSDRI